MPKPDDPTATELKCICGEENCKVGMRITNISDEKTKIQIFDKEDIKTVIVDKKNLKELLK